MVNNKSSSFLFCLILSAGVLHCDSDVASNQISEQDLISDIEMAAALGSGESVMVPLDKLPDGLGEKIKQIAADLKEAERLRERENMFRGLIIGLVVGLLLGIKEYCKYRKGR